MAMRRMNHHLTERQAKLLKVYSKQVGVSMAEILRRFVNAGLEKAGFDANSDETEEKGITDDTEKVS